MRPFYLYCWFIIYSFKNFYSGYPEFTIYVSLIRAYVQIIDTTLFPVYGLSFNFLCDVF